MKHILLTVGTNPVPVMVAARRLWESWGPEGATLSFLHSPQTADLAHIIIETLIPRLRLEKRPDSWHLIKVENAVSPSAISDAIKSHFLPNCNAGDEIHFHYTGGTKAMGIQAFRALLSNPGKCPVSDSYLDPRDNRVVDGQGNLVDPNVMDERATWNLSVEQLARLHGLTTEFKVGRGKVRVQLRKDISRTAYTAPNPSPRPSHDMVSLCLTLGRDLIRNFYHMPPKGPNKFYNQVTKWKNSLEAEDYWPFLPVAKLRKNWVWPDIDNANAALPSIPEQFNTVLKLNQGGWAPGNGGQFEIDPFSLTELQLEEMLGICKGGWLEVIAWDALRQAIERLG